MKPRPRAAGVASPPEHKKRASPPLWCSARVPRRADLRPRRVCREVRWELGPGSRGEGLGCSRGGGLGPLPGGPQLSPRACRVSHPCAPGKAARAEAHALQCKCRAAGASRCERSRGTVSDTRRAGASGPRPGQGPQGGCRGTGLPAAPTGHALGAGRHAEAASPSRGTWVFVWGLIPRTLGPARRARAWEGAGKSSPGPGGSA